jgi:RsiW-degrading membrane proteinase PrsW (M82 family)
MFPSDPKILGLALLGGIVPSLVWLWFWLKEEDKRHEPVGLLTVCFLVGMIAVFFVLPIERFIQSNFARGGFQVVGWAAAEELMKYLAVFIIVRRSGAIDDPLDWAIYLMTAALGFAALENALFLLKPLSLSQATVGVLTGQLRFLGSTLLHTISSATIGISIGLSFYMDKFRKNQYLVAGIVAAIALHSAFNFFIMKGEGSDFLKVFGFLWVVTIVVMLLFEKLRRMKS